MQTIKRLTISQHFFHATNQKQHYFILLLNQQHWRNVDFVIFLQKLRICLKMRIVYSNLLTFSKFKSKKSHFEKKTQFLVKNKKKTPHISQCSHVDRKVQYVAAVGGMRRLGFHVTVISINPNSPRSTLFRSLDILLSLCSYCVMHTE